MQPDAVQAVRDYLAQCNGSEHWYDHWARRIRYTDGVRYCASNLGAWWLVDLIASHQLSAEVRAEPFQAWCLRLKVAGAGAGWLAICEDGNKRELVRQAIDWTDFPAELQPFTLWLENRTLMLPQER